MKMLVKNLLIMFFLFFSVTLSVGQENDFISRLKTQLLLFRTQKVDQVIVIQSDKSLYRQGETIWMKGYVTDATTHSLSLNSLELSVQLTTSKGNNILDGKYLLRNGVSDFNFTIPADLPSDVYYLIAYTPEMENGDIGKIFKKEIFINRPENLEVVPHLDFGKPFFNADSKETAMVRLMNFGGKPIAGKKFEYQIYNQERELLSGKGKTASNGTGEVVFFTPPASNRLPLFVSLTIPAGRDHLNLISKIPIASEKINVTFYPEGGKRVPGIPQLIVYEAKDQIGNPIDLKSDILDEAGKIVLTTATIEPGLGAFTLLNGEKGNLTMRISSDIGRSQEIQLPPLAPGNLSMSIKKSDEMNLSLLLGRAPKSEPRKFKIVAVSNGELVWASEFELEQSGVINVPLENFHSAITSFAVFNQSGELVSQRLISTGKAQPLNISFSSVKNVYKPGEQGQFTVRITDLNGKPVKAELAATLCDKYSFPTSLQQLDAIMDGTEKPLQINVQTGKINSEILDFRLISNSLKGFEWSRVLAVDPVKGSVKIPGAIRISGTVIDENNIPVPYALVNLNSTTLQQFNASSDQHGEFAVNIPVSIERNNLSASATDGTGKRNFKVKLHKSFKEELLNSLNLNTVYDWQILDKMDQANYFQENSDYFKARSSVRVRGAEKKPNEPYWKRYLNSSSNLLEIIKTIRPFEMSGEKIVFRGMNSILAQDGALIVIDGQRVGTDASQLSIVNPQDVEDIRILLDPVEMGMYTSLNSVGVIEIKTKHGMSNESKSNEVADNTNNNAVKLFTPEAIGEAKYDLKTTLQWFPVLYTDENGEAIIPFKTGGIKSTFILEITGISSHRQWIRATSEIKVE